MEKKTVEEISKMSIEELSKYVVEMQGDYDKSLEQLRSENTSLKEKIETDKKASIGMILGATSQPRKEEDVFDLSDIL